MLFSAVNESKRSNMIRPVNLYTPICELIIADRYLSSAHHILAIHSYKLTVDLCRIFTLAMQKSPRFLISPTNGCGHRVAMKLSTWQVLSSCLESGCLGMDIHTYETPLQLKPQLISPNWSWSVIPTDTPTTPEHWHQSTKLYPPTTVCHLGIGYIHGYTAHSTSFF